MNKSYGVLTLFVSTALLLSGCGGGGSSNSTSGGTTPASNITTTVTPYKGMFTSGNVVLKDANGNTITLVSGGSINANGKANVTFPASVTFPITVEVSGTYIDETTGTTAVITAGSPLRGMIPSSTDANAVAGVPVTAITDLARATLPTSGFSAASAVAAITGTANNILGITTYADAMKPPVFNSNGQTSDANTLKLTALAHVISQQAGNGTLHAKLQNLSASLIAGSAVNAVIPQTTFNNALAAVNTVGGASGIVPVGVTPPTIPTFTLPPVSLGNLIAGGSSGGTTPTAQPTLSSVIITPTTQTMAVGQTVNFSAMGTYSDGRTIDVTHLVVWSSSDSAVVSNDGGFSSLNSTTLIKFTARAIGSANLSATPVGGVSSSISVTVTPAISVTPPSPYTGVGLTEQLSAIGTYSDSTKLDITNQVNWTSSNTAVATINANSGLATGVSLGSTTITATYGATAQSVSLTVGNTPWSSAGSLQTARWQFESIVLPNGRLLVIGGLDALTKTWLATAELYDSATNSWTSAGKLSFARYSSSNSSLLLSNGKVLVTGGANGSGYSGITSPTTELYDPTSNTWTVAEPMITARHFHFMTQLANGNVLAMGGYYWTTGLGVGGAAYQSPVYNVELYDTVNNKWSSSGSLTFRVSLKPIQLPNGEVLVVGCGLDQGANYSCSRSAIYHPSSNTWTDTGIMAMNNAYSTILLKNGMVLALGYPATTGLSLSAELYDPSTNIWTVVGELPAYPNSSATLLQNGKVLLESRLSSPILYDSTSNTWLLTGNKATGYFNQTSILLPDGRVLALGGNTASYGGNFSSPEVYDPVTNSWSQTGNFNQVRAGYSSNLLTNGKVLIIGGGVSTGGALPDAIISWRW